MRGCLLGVMDDVLVLGLCHWGVSLACVVLSGVVIDSVDTSGGSSIYAGLIRAALRLWDVSSTTEQIRRDTPTHVPGKCQNFAYTNSF